MLNWTDYILDSTNMGRVLQYCQKKRKEKKNKTIQDNIYSKPDSCEDQVKYFMGSEKRFWTSGFNSKCKEIFFFQIILLTRIEGLSLGWRHIKEAWFTSVIKDDLAEAV